MKRNNDAEQFVTLFDSNFLPMGMALHASLVKHAQPFHLWILCMDTEVVQQLERCALPNVTLIPLSEVETEALLNVKGQRSTSEYCWTLTPFTPQFVFDREPDASRVTYLDADLYFFDSPCVLLDEFSKSGKHVLITDHRYAPEYDQSRSYGRFCVQFMTFRNTDQGRKVMTWWQQRCIEWCHARREDGKFGDQKYLDDWPERFRDEVHVLKQGERTMAPWNVAYIYSGKKKAASLKPVFYHFHGLRIVSHERILLYRRYRTGPASQWIYNEYSEAIVQALKWIHGQWGTVPILPERAGFFDYLLRLVFRFLSRIQYREFVLPADNSSGGANEH